MLTIAIVLIVSAGVVFAGTSGKRSLEEELAALNKKSTQLISEAAARQQEYEETLRAFEIYENIPEHKLPANDYDNIQSRIRISRPIIERLKRKYKFTGLDVRLSKINPETPLKKGDNYVIVSNEVTIDFDGLTDDLVYSFIEELIHEIPGYLHLR